MVSMSRSAMTIAKACDDLDHVRAVIQNARVDLEILRSEVHDLLTGNVDLYAKQVLLGYIDVIDGSLRSAVH